MDSNDSLEMLMFECFRTQVSKTELNACVIFVTLPSATCMEIFPDTPSHRPTFSSLLLLNNRKKRQFHSQNVYRHVCLVSELLELGVDLRAGLDVVDLLGLGGLDLVCGSRLDLTSLLELADNVLVFPTDFVS